MIDRREFVRLGLLSSLPVCGGLAAFGQDSKATDAGALRLDGRTVVIDPRSRPAAQLAKLLEAAGARTVALDNGDITDFWFTYLDRKWRELPVPICGMTDYPALFLLERFAWDRGLRVVFHAEHRPLSADSVSHTLTGPSITVGKVRGLIESPSWDRAVMTAFANSEIDASTARIDRAIGHYRMADADLLEPLYSWVIAPRGV
jgi:hypothetical protein